MTVNEQPYGCGQYDYHIKELYKTEDDYYDAIDYGRHIFLTFSGDLYH